MEDDEEINEYLCRELAEDFHLTSCGNGKEAIELLHKQSFNLVVSDIMMPEMDGISLCKHIKQHLQFNHIPIILLTAKTRETDNITGLAVGADAYITKPFSLNILRSTILSLIQNRLALKNSFSGTQEIGNKVESPTLQSPDEKLMERIIKVVNDNLSNTEISVKQIADEIGISTVHLNRKLKRAHQPNLQSLYPQHPFAGCRTFTGRKEALHRRSERPHRFLRPQLLLQVIQRALWYVSHCLYERKQSYRNRLIIKNKRPLPVFHGRGRNEKN